MNHPDEWKQIQNQLKCFAPKKIVTYKHKYQFANYWSQLGNKSKLTTQSKGEGAAVNWSVIYHSLTTAEVRITSNACMMMSCHEKGFYSTVSVTVYIKYYCEHPVAGYLAHHVTQGLQRKRYPTRIYLKQERRWNADKPLATLDP